MRRLVIVALVGLIVVGLVPTSSAGKKKKPIEKVTRVEKVAYEYGSYGVAGQANTRSCGDPNIGCAQFKAEPTERFVRIEIKDMTGQPPLGQLEVDGEVLAFFCGTSELPVEIPAGADVTVWVMGNIVPFYACGIVTGFPTQGEVEAVFSNIP